MLPTCLRSKKAAIPQSMSLLSKNIGFPQIGWRVVAFHQILELLQVTQSQTQTASSLRKGSSLNANLHSRVSALSPNRLSGTAFPNCRLGLSSYDPIPLVCPESTVQSLGGGRVENMIMDKSGFSWCCVGIVSVCQISTQWLVNQCYYCQSSD